MRLRIDDPHYHFLDTLGRLLGLLMTFSTVTGMHLVPSPSTHYQPKF